MEKGNTNSLKWGIHNIFIYRKGTKMLRNLLEKNLNYFQDQQNNVIFIPTPTALKTNKLWISLLARCVKIREVGPGWTTWLLSRIKIRNKDQRSKHLFEITFYYDLVLLQSNCLEAPNPQLCVISDLIYLNGGKKVRKECWRSKE